MSDKLTEMKLTILSLVSKWKERWGTAPTGPGIALSLGWRREDATTTLRALLKDGLVGRPGKRGNAWRWDITTAGRQALKEHK